MRRSPPPQIRDITIALAESLARRDDVREPEEAIRADSYL